jgi:hypothetical protein
MKTDDGKKTSEKKSPAVVGNEQPPKLQTKLWQGLKLLMLINLLPILGLAYLGMAWYNGKVALKADVTSKHVMTILFVLGGCMVIAVSSWFVMPLARWIKAYPTWHFRKQSRIAWFLPMLAGHLGWALCCLIGAAATLASVAVILTGLWQMIASMAGQAGK